METSTNIYRLDRRNRITEVSGPWDEFALANGGEAACAAKVLHRSIWDFVAGETARMWLDALLQLSRLRNEVSERCYRCDSPKLKRFMRMKIIPENRRGQLRLEHDQVSVAKANLPAYVYCDGVGVAGDRRLRCSICGQLRTTEGWRETELGDADPPVTIAVVYTVCDSCWLFMPHSDDSAAGGGEEKSR